MNRTVRNEYAELLRGFIGGQITNFEYEDRFDKFDLGQAISDPAINEIFGAMWSAYCDIREHKMTGKFKLVGENRETAIRFILFLHSSFPYEWPVQSLSERLLNLLTVGLYGKLQKIDPVQAAGDESVWPFYRKEEYEYSLQNPRLLSGCMERSEVLCREEEMDSGTVQPISHEEFLKQINRY